MKKEDSFGTENLAFQHEDASSADGPPGQAKGNNHVTTIYNDDSNAARSQWGNSSEFLMSCIAMSVGLGNIWRFPFTAYENGGGAFLIPYIIVLVVIGRPLYYMEMALGQFASRGNVQTFAAMAPALKGVGYGQLFSCVCLATYYCSLMAITLMYLIRSFTANLPWAECRPEWLTADANVTCLSTVGNRSLENTISSSELFFTKEVLKEITTIDNGIGLPEWRLSLLLLAAWTVTFVVSRRGVQTSGKASYFLAIFPYVIMLALLVRAVTLDGAIDGILFFIRPKWDRLADPAVWYAAVTQCFFSLNVGFGTIVMYSSYNSFDHNIKRDALVVTTLDTFTSLLAGATIFGILGNLAHELGADINQVVNSGGTGLAFISYPEAIAKFETVPWLFAILFFVMLFVLGVGSLVALHGCVITVVTDAFPTWRKWQVSSGSALLGFLLGLVYLTPGGQFILTLVDHFAGTFIIFVLAIIEVVLVMWWYGVDNFCTDIEFMIKEKVGVYWRICWCIVTPVLLILIFVYFILNLHRLQHSGHDYPDIALVCGWLLFVFAMAQLLYIAVRSVCTYHSSGVSWTASVARSLDSQDWAPADAHRREEYVKFKEHRRTELLTLRLTTWQKLVYMLTGGYCKTSEA